MLKPLRALARKHFPRLAEIKRGANKAASFRYCYQHRSDTLDVATATTRESIKAPAGLIDRLVASYNARSETPSGLWSEIYLGLHGDIHEAFIRNDRKKIEEILDNPASCDLFYGFENNARTLHRKRRIEDIHAPALTLDALVSFAEAIGARRLDNPEGYERRPVHVKPDDVIAQIEKGIASRLPIPTPFPQEYGVVCSRGIMSYRVPQAIYQAWRIAELVKGVANPRVLEIGGGLGRTAFYARLFGVLDYTIIDIPVSSLAQGDFLGRVLGGDAIRLQGEAGETGTEHPIKLLAPGAFLGAGARYDLIVNVDSLTEMGPTVAGEYWSAIEEKADMFLSINHESNAFTVAELIAASTRITEKSRMPYWLRRGYVEELCKFTP